MSGLLRMTTAMMKAKTARTIPQSIQVRFNALLLAPDRRSRGREFYPGRERISRKRGSNLNSYNYLFPALNRADICPAKL
jgi:hypothetical protein